jgi:SAM-dependent methyltransferase
VSKRDDDSQTDMEVGMTTAERRRRRRRGGGLRVPSDNVPRRSSTPPVAPVPEDPSLAMSIAYSFTSEAPEPMPRASRETIPSFENHEAMPTVIDPVSGPVEQADFDMKTREMTAVDLEALGLSEAGVSSSTLPIQRITSPGMESVIAMEQETREASVARVQFTKRDATDPVDDVDVEIDSGVEAMDGMDGRLDGRSMHAHASSADDDHADDELDGDEVSDDEVSGDEVSDDDVSDDEVSDDDLSDEASELSELESTELAAITVTAPAVSEASQPRPPMTDASQPRSPMTSAAMPPVTPPALPTMPLVTPPALAFKSSRAQTVALSEDDLEEVREARRLATVPPARPQSTSLPPPMPVGKPAEVKPRSAEPASVPEIDIMALEDKAAEASGDFEVDVEGIIDARSAPVAVPASPSGPTALPERARRPSNPLPQSPGQPPPANPPPLVHGHAPPAIPPPLAHGQAPPASPPPLAHAHSQSIPPPLAHGHPASSPPPLAHGHPASNPPPLAHGHPASNPPPSAPQPRDSQPLPIIRDPQHASPPPPPVAHKAPPSPPPGKKDKAPGPVIATPGAKPDGKPARGKPWFVDLFDEDYLRTLPFLTPQATQAEAEFVIDAMGLTPGAQVLDVGCGYGRHAMELAARGFHVVGLDMSTPLLVRGGEEAHRRGLTINFVRGDMRELDFEAQFDGAYCLFSTFGYFDDETNKKTIANIARALKPGGRVLIEILNRDYVIADLPTRVWWEGDGCVVLEEVELNYFSSRIQVNRSVVFDDGRQLEQEISVRAYSLHEVGKLLHAAGFRVLEVSGAYHTRGRFFGNQSRHIIVLAERKDPGAT